LHPAAAGREGGPVWCQDHEVTAGEYLAFLNDAETRRAIAAARTPLYFPRGPEDALAGGDWPRTDDLHFALPSWAAPEFPVLRVSHDDAVAYATWCTRHARAAGAAYVFRLPRFDEWLAAGYGGSNRNFVFGDTFWPRWFNSCYSRAAPGVEPVLSYPIDESPCGVYDMTGGAMEWLDAWYGEGEQRRRLVGGGWASVSRDLSKVHGGMGLEPERTTGESGFRLVLVFADEAR
jgi:formylglycine-generating enzyme required for sulfatase activity